MKYLLTFLLFFSFGAQAKIKWLDVTGGNGFKVNQIDFLKDGVRIFTDNQEGDSFHISQKSLRDNFQLSTKDFADLITEHNGNTGSKTLFIRFKEINPFPPKSMDIKEIIIRP